jgi:hypothetical protein
MLLDVSWLRQCRLDTLEDPDLADSTRFHTLEYIDARAEPILRELKRRHDQHERYKHDASIHPWPDATRYEATLRLARELKRAIPLSTYTRLVFPDVRLERHGDTWRGHCPFHQDDHPSFVIYDEARFTCFAAGCGMQGDIYALVALGSGCERFTDQVANLAAWAKAVTS